MTVLLVNLLIAMMGNTYSEIAGIRNEWMRQVSSIYFRDSINVQLEIIDDDNRRSVLYKIVPFLLPLDINYKFECKRSHRCPFY